MKIRTKTRINSVTKLRLDWYETPAGPRQQYCACSGIKKCLYHWYYEDKVQESPKNAYKHGDAVEHAERPAQKRPTKDDRRPSDKRRYQSPDSTHKPADASVRPSGGRTGNRPKSRKRNAA